MMFRGAELTLVNPSPKGKGWKRTIRLVDTTLSIEQTTALPADKLTADRRGNVDFHIEHPAANRATYSLR